MFPSSSPTPRTDSSTIRCRFRSCLFIVISAAIATLLTGCDKAEEKPKAHVVVKATYPGATAEEIRTQFLILNPELKLAVIHDGHAQAYFELSKEELDALLDSRKGKFGADLKFEEVESVATSIPTPPEQEETDNVETVLNNAKLAELGISPGDASILINAYLPEVTPGTMPDPVAISQLEIALPDGSMVKIGDIATVKPVKIYRPLVIDRQD